MKVVTPEGYTFVTKFQEDNSHKVLRSVDFFSIKFDEIFFDTVCWAAALLLSVPAIPKIVLNLFAPPFSMLNPTILVRQKTLICVISQIMFLMFPVLQRYLPLIDSTKLFVLQSFIVMTFLSHQILIILLFLVIL